MRDRNRPCYTYIEQIIKDLGTNCSRKVNDLIQDCPNWRFDCLVNSNITKWCILLHAEYCFRHHAVMHHAI